jgi:hypothetical protein
LVKEIGYRGTLENARDLVQQAISLLDAAGAPADIAAHLDLAAQRLATEIDTPEPSLPN